MGIVIEILDPHTFGVPKTSFSTQPKERYQAPNKRTEPYTQGTAPKGAKEKSSNAMSPPRWSNADILGVDSLSILFSHRSFQKPIAISPGCLVVF